MAITKTLFGTIPESNEDVYNYTLDNGKISAQILTLGGIIKNLYVLDKNGVKTDVVLGRDTLEEYLNNDGYIGALIGRHANRIKKGYIPISGTYATINEGKNSLHGGIHGFDSKVWSAQAIDNPCAPTLSLSLISPDGDEGFPGTLFVNVKYTLSESSIIIDYTAYSDKDTVCNLTNHSYFNLAGHCGGTVDKHILCIESGFYTPNDSECMPTGEVYSVEGTPFDFREPKAIGKDINADHPQIQAVGGYDHNFMLKRWSDKPAATVLCEETGIEMRVHTDQPAMQLYTANALPKGVHKDGSGDYPIHGALCLETQCTPNALEFSHYPGPFLKKGETYHTVTRYEFVKGE